MKNFRLLNLRQLALLVLVTGLLFSNLGGADRAWFATTLSAQSVDTSGSAQLAVLHAFVGGGAVRPNSAPLQATDGSFYGTTSNGGAFDFGTVYTITSEGTVTVLHAFAGGPYDGSSPGSALIQASDGNFYGTTVSGGASDQGTVFTITPDGALTVLHSFAGASTDGSYPRSALIQATDGNFYGTTSSGGASGRGTVFTIIPGGGIVTVLHSFAGGSADGSDAYGALLQATDGNFYGTTATGGASGQGTVFTMTPVGTVTVLHSFAGGTPDGAYPYAALIQAADGNFYGTTQNGGPFGQGTVFTITPAGTFTQLHAFLGGPTDGSLPFAASLIQAIDGNFYGTTQNGGPSGQGTVFTITPAGTFTLLHAFSGGQTDGARPGEGLLQTSDGLLYGTTENGGAFGQGTIFAVIHSDTVIVLLSFNGGGTDGTRPDSALVQATDGNFYGTTQGGGLSGFGTVFTMSPAGTVTILHTFDPGSGGGSSNDNAALLQATAAPSRQGSANAALLQATDGNLYGITGSGGASGQGTVFRMTPDGTFTVLHSFAGGTTDGAYPHASLIQATDGNFYGTTSAGGAFGQGTAFTITPIDGTVTVLHSFAGGTTDGAYPYAALLQASDGHFYGTTQGGGAFGQGTLFAITPAGTITVLHAFAGGTADGAYPSGSLIQALDGNFYGTTERGGASHQGTVFTMTPAGALTVLHAFTGGTDGAYPGAGLLRAADGNFYGTALIGGATGFGTVFTMTPAGTVTVLHAFAGATTDGAYPRTALLQALDGSFYGTTGDGGAFSQGVAFRLTISQRARITYPVNGATDVDLTLPVQWTSVPNAQAYYLYVGTTPGAKDLVNTGEIQQTSFLARGVPGDRLVFARIWAKVGGVWRFSDSSFTTAPAVTSAVIATLTSPVNGATNVDLTVPIQWTTVPDAQAYYLYIGTTVGAKDLVNSREIQQTWFMATGVPSGQIVFARIWTKVGGIWRFSDSTFTAAAAAPLVATLTAPVNGAINVDLTVPIQWTPVVNAQAYYLYVGTTVGEKDLVNSREIQQTSFVAKGVPSGQTVFARIWTKVGGVWRFSDSTFTTVAVVAILTAPVNGATDVDLTLPIRWTTVPNAQAYYLYVGTAPGAKDLVNTGEIQQTSYVALGVPGGQTVFARIWTKVGGVWRFSDSSFTTSAVTVLVVATLTYPVNGATDVYLDLSIQWTPVLNTQAYYLYVGTSVGANDLVNSREIQQTSFAATGLPSGQTVFARIWTKVGGVWRFSDSSFTTLADC